MCLLKRALDGRRRIRENRLVAEVDIGFAHQVGKHPRHAAIGDEIRNHGQLTICRFCDGTVENFSICEGHIGATGDDLNTRFHHAIQLVLCDQSRGRAGQEHVRFHIPNSCVYLIEGKHVSGVQTVALFGFKQLGHLFK